MLKVALDNLKKLQHWLFPPNLDRKKKAELLLEFEELYKRREEIIQELNQAVADYESIAQQIRIMLQLNPFKMKGDGQRISGVVDIGGLDRLEEYDTIKKKAVEYETLYFRIFTIRQKLKLYGIDSSIKDGDNVIS